MKKHLLALLAVTALGVSVVSATPQTTFEKGETQLDLGAYRHKAEVVTSSENKWNFTGGVTYALSDKTAVQYAYTGMKAKHGFGDGNMQELNVIHSLNKNVALYGGYGRIDTGYWDKVNNIAQIGVIGKAPLGDKFEVYGKAAVGTKSTTSWEAGVGYKATDDLDVHVGYRYTNTEGLASDSISMKGLVAGLSYRFGGSAKEEAAPATVYEPPRYVEPPQAPVQAKKDYYVQSIYFDVDSSALRASETPKLEQMVAVAKEYPGERIKLVGNTDSDASNDYNKALSERRVQSVAQYAVDHGVETNRLVGLYNGESKPVATNDTAQGKQENRRVDVYVNRY